MTTIQINNEPTEVPAGAIAYKYTDPTEEARWLYDEAEVEEIERVDPGLIVRVGSHAEAVNAIETVEAGGTNPPGVRVDVDTGAILPAGHRAPTTTEEASRSETQAESIVTCRKHQNPRATVTWYTCPHGHQVEVVEVLDVLDAYTFDGCLTSEYRARGYTQCADCGR